MNGEGSFLMKIKRINSGIQITLSIFEYIQGNNIDKFNRLMLISVLEYVPVGSDGSDMFTLFYKVELENKNDVDKLIRILSIMKINGGVDKEELKGYFNET